MPHPHFAIRNVKQNAERTDTFSKGELTDFFFDNITLGSEWAAVRSIRKCLQCFVKPIEPSACRARSVLGGSLIVVPQIRFGVFRNNDAECHAS